MKNIRNMAMYDISKLFFPIVQSPVIVNNQFVQKYYAITKTEDNEKFLGIKRAWQDYNTNEAAYEKAMELFYVLTGINGDKYKWWINNDENLCSILIRGLGMNEFAHKFKNQILDSIEKEFSKIKHKEFSSLFSGNELFQKPGGYSGDIEKEFMSFVDNKLVHLDLNIGLVNGYDIDYSCNYFAVIRWIDKDNKTKYLAIARSKNIENIDLAAQDFKNQLFDFILTSFKRFITQIDKKYIRPILFDIYNKNISTTTIENDDEYRRSLVEFNKSTNDFVNDLQSYNYYAFTEFMIKNYFMFEDTPDGIKVYNKESIISTNQKYKDSLNRLKNLYFNENKRRDYEFNNFHKLDAVEYLLKY